MSSAQYTLLTAAVLVLIYYPLRTKGSVVGWWLGVGHGLLAIGAIAGWSTAQDIGFAVAMALAAIYAGAMSASEAVHRLRHAASKSVH